MFTLSISSTPALFSKFFSASDAEAVVEAIPAGTTRVVFIDTPATPHLVDEISALKGKGITVAVRDHHDVVAPRNPREEEIRDAAAKVRTLADDAQITDRVANPACSTLIEAGEFASEGTVIVADPDLDGLTGAMKACGVTYEGLDADAAVFDERPRQSAETLTTLGWLTVRALSTLPPFNPKAPQVSEDAKGKLFGEFVQASQGDSEALTSLQTKVEAYEVAVAAAQALVGTATEPAPGVFMVDTRKAPRHDLGTLSQGLEKLGAKITVVIKANGPIAAAHGGTQVSLAVVRKFQKEINLQDCLPEGFESSPATGVISNTSFLLHVNEEVWESTVLPALKARFAA